MNQKAKGDKITKVTSCKTIGIFKQTDQPQILKKNFHYAPRGGLLIFLSPRGRA